MKKIYSYFTVLTTLLFCISSQAQTTLESDKQKFSYAVGVQLAQNMLRQSIQVEPEAFIQSIRDVLNRSPLKLTPQEMQQVLVSYQQQQIKAQQLQGQKNLIAGQSFLAENRNKKGVIQTDSGLQYKVIHQGEGKKPNSSDTVLVHYRGTLTDGKEFDSSYKRGQPVSFKVSGVIKGWQEILPMMNAGSKWQIYVPPHLGYGERGAGADIPPNSALIFDVELLSIK